ncbi:uncharacterized protein G2W53_018390 [Senna tora]|uniref:Uncharacterized protein n=1 Tax=Senna tora TaxID=362788 RepID=A0A834WPT3_9FABA|nr:uncharacterized protein G2W53_018390 [Senna tora]
MVNRAILSVDGRSDDERWCFCVRALLRCA